MKFLESQLAASQRLYDGRWENPAYRIALRCKALIGATFITLVNSLVRIKRIGFESYLKAISTNQPTLLVAWHGSMISSIFCHRRRNIIIMTSLSKDGDLLTWVLHNLGFKTVRGSSSRGGMRGLLEMIRLLSAGFNGAITVDGPRGPIHQVKPGAALVAKKTGALLFPLGLAFSNSWQLKNWDQTHIPLPGSRVVMVTGSPFRLDSKLSTEGACEEIRKNIFSAQKNAESFLNND
jgi:hypothetical protein